MTNLAHPPTWFATLLLLPLWLTGLVLAGGLSALLVLVRRWRAGARGRAFDSQPALWPADIPTYRRSFAVLSAEIARHYYPAAWGANKKEAEQKAAMNALAAIRGEEVPYPADF